MSVKHCNERKEAAEILVKVFCEGAYSSVILQQTFRKHPEWDSRQRGLITNLVYTVLTHHLRLEAMVNLYAKLPVRRMKPYVAVVLMLSAAQLLWMPRIPQSAVVDEAVKLILHSPWRGLSGFVNGTLRSMLRENLRESWPEAEEDLLAHLSVRYSIPRWILELWQSSYGTDIAKRLAQNLNQPRDLSLRCNTYKITPEELRQRLIQNAGEERIHRGRCCHEALRVSVPGDISQWEEFRQGLMTVQDESSMFCAYALDPQPGEKILDLCAAPGGKATHMAQRMQNRGLVEARDIHEHKIGLMRENAERMGLSIVEPRLRDAAEFWEQDREAWDRVLLDAPCSGLGILRNKPDLKLHKDMQELRELIPLQRKMIENAALCVKPGGTLVYSTCTLNPGENEDNVEWFLQAHPEFVPEDLTNGLPEGFLPEIYGRGYIYILPEKDFFDGFFIAKLCKKGVK